MTANISTAPVRLHLRALLPASVLSATAVLAQPVLAGETLALPPLVVTGAALHSPVTVVTDPKAPRQPVPAGDGADYLKTIPGFAMVRSGGVNGDPVFRGMFGSRLNILTNGGLLLGACPNRMDAPTAYITPESYDRLTVIKGPQTVLWGPGASAATVLFEREPERFAEPGGRLDATLLAGSRGRFDRRLDAAAGAEQGYARLLASRASADDYEDGDGETVPSRFDRWSSDLALGWTPDDDTLVELTLGTGDGESRYAGRSMDGVQFERDSLALRAVRENLGETLRQVEARVYYNHADHVMDNFTLRTPDASSPMMTMRNPLANNVERRTLGARVAGTWGWDAFELEAGVDAQTNLHRLRQSSYAMMSGTYTDYDRYPWREDAEFHNYGVFGELTWRADSRNRVVTGARLDRASAEDEREQLVNKMGMSWANPSADHTRADTLPSGFVRYERDLTALRATTYVGLGHVQRFPDYWELFSASVVNGVPPAFVEIQPEKTTQLDAGIQYREGPLEAWASVYAGQVRDYILFNYTLMPSGHIRTSAQNVDARIAGGELGGAYRFGGGWKSEASLAYAWGKNRSDDQPLPQIPPLEARFSLGYEQDDWSAAALWRVVAEQTRIAENQGTVVGRDFAESDGFGVLSLNGAYRVNPHLKLSAGIDNLLDKTYSEHLNLAGNAAFGFPGDERVNEPGRTGWLRADLRF